MQAECCPLEFELPEPVKFITKSDGIECKPLSYDNIYFFDVDEYVRTLLKTEMDSFYDFVWFLIFKKENFSPLQRTRAIYYWLCNADFSLLKFVEEAPQEVKAIQENFLQMIKKLDYPNIFQLLTSLAGCPCITIEGYSKSKSKQYAVNYDIEILPKLAANWNVIITDDTCQFVDICQFYEEIRKLQTNNNEAGENDVTLIDRDMLLERYFLINPQFMLANYVSANKFWTEINFHIEPSILVKSTLSDFLKCLSITWNYISSKLSIINHKNNGPGPLLPFEVTVLQKTERFCYSIKGEQSEKSNFILEINPVLPANGEVKDFNPIEFTTIEYARDCFHIYSQFPLAGNYFISIFQTLVSEQLDDPNLDKHKQFLCQYKLIQMDEIGLTNVRKFPSRNVGFNWMQCQNSGLNFITHKSSIIEMSTNIIQIQIFNDGQKYSNLHGALLINETKSPVLPELNRGVNIFNFSLPDDGYYLFKVFGTINESDDCEFLGQYLLCYSFDFATENRSKLVSSPVSGFDEVCKKCFLFEDPNELEPCAKTFPDPESSEVFTPDIFTKSDFSQCDCLCEYDRTCRKHEQHGVCENFGSFKTYNVDDSQTLEMPLTHNLNDEIVLFCSHFLGSIDSNHLNDYEFIVREIFLYLASIRTINQANLRKMQLEDPIKSKVVEGLINGSIMYSKIFDKICKNVGIESHIVCGFSKGLNYKAGMVFDESDINTNLLHSWNVVKFKNNNRWQIYDCLWASIPTPKTEIDLTNLEKVYIDEFYFNANPDQLKFTHYPLNKKWMLTETPFSLKEFEDSVPLRSAFFVNNLSLESHASPIIECSQPYQIIIIGCENNKTVDIMLDLYTENKDKTQYQVRDYCISEQVENDTERITVRFPTNGVYYLKMFCRGFGSSFYSLALEYRINVNCDSKIEFLPAFPHSNVTRLGSTEYAAQFNATYVSQITSFRDVNEYKELEFIFPEKLNVNLTFNLIDSNNSPYDELKARNILLESRQPSDEDESSSLVHNLVTIFFPKTGQHILQIFASSDKISQPLLVYQIYFEVSLRYKQLPLPEMIRNAPEVKANTAELGLKLIYPPKCIIDTSNLVVLDNMPEIAHCYVDLLKKKCGHKIVMLSVLEAGDNKDQSLRNYSLIQQIEDEDSEKGLIRVLVRIPSEGMYKLQIFAVPSSVLFEKHMSNFSNSYIRMEDSSSFVEIFAKPDCCNNNSDIGSNCYTQRPSLRVPLCYMFLVLGHRLNEELVLPYPTQYFNWTISVSTMPIYYIEKPLQRVLIVDRDDLEKNWYKFAIKVSYAKGVYLIMENIKMIKLLKEKSSNRWKVRAQLPCNENIKIKIVADLSIENKNKKLTALISYDTAFENIL